MIFRLFFCSFSILFSSHGAEAVLSVLENRIEIVDTVEFIASKPLYHILLHQKQLSKKLRKMRTIDVLEGIEYLFNTPKTKNSIRRIAATRIKKRLLIYYLAKGCRRKYQHNELKLKEFSKKMDLEYRLIEKYVEEKAWKAFIIYILGKNK